MNRWLSCRCWTTCKCFLFQCLCLRRRPIGWSGAAERTTVWTASWRRGLDQSRRTRAEWRCATRYATRSRAASPAVAAGAATSSSRANCRCGTSAAAGWRTRARSSARCASPRTTRSTARRVRLQESWWGVVLLSADVREGSLESDYIVCYHIIYLIPYISYIKQCSHQVLLPKICWFLNFFKVLQYLGDYSIWNTSD